MHVTSNPGDYYNKVGMILCMLIGIEIIPEKKTQLLSRFGLMS